MASFCGIPAIDPQITKDICKRIAKHMKYLNEETNIKPTNCPGAAVLAIQNGRVVANVGYGMADISKGTPIDSSTIFDLASLSKNFTAAACLQLYQQGLIDLEAPVSRYITDLVHSNVKVRHILHHTSGLPDYTRDEEMSDKVFKKMVLSTFLKWLNNQKPTLPPGTEWRYNNTGYALLALLVERISGQPFSAYMKNQVFHPLGMTSTFVCDSKASTPLPQAGQRAEGYVLGPEKEVESCNLTGKEHKGIPVTRNYSFMHGDGNVFTCTADMEKYCLALRGVSFLSAHTKSVMFTPGRFDDGSEMDADYSGGFYVTDIEDEPAAAVQHSGCWDGTATGFRFYTRDDRAIVVLSNNYALDVMQLLNDVDCIMEGIELGAVEYDNDEEEEDEEDEEEEDEEDEEEEDEDEEEEDDEEEDEDEEEEEEEAPPKRKRTSASKHCTGHIKKVLLKRR